MTHPLRIHGAFTALVTPFCEQGSRVDVAALQRIVQAQIDAGVDGLVPCGTTGESPALAEEEHLEVVRHTVALARPKVPVVAGAGANVTAKATRLAVRCVEAGADAIMIVMPYYNKPSQEGLRKHVTAISAAVAPVPIVLYNIPGRCGVDLGLDTLARIVDDAPNVVAIKDATGNVLRCQETVARFGDALTVMSGDDALTLAMMACGARGVISVTSNVVPSRVSAVCRAMLQGRWAEAQQEHFALLPLHHALFAEPSPGPVKAALQALGLIELSLRLPMLPPSAACQAAVQHAMKAIRSERGT